MGRYDLRLNCHRCGAFTEYTHKWDDPDTVVRCGGCGKRHSLDSVHMVDTTRRYDRNEDGTLLENIA